MNRFEVNRTSKSDFLKINEDDLMFITYPGRMGDEDGSTFIVRNGNDFIIYRVDGWMYGKDMDISLNDMLNQFPQWKESLEEKSDEKYKCIYMGFGNRLFVDNSIYDEFKPYLDEKVSEDLEGKEDKESLKYASIFSVWVNAFIDMVKDKGYVLRKKSNRGEL